MGGGTDSFAIAFAIVTNTRIPFSTAVALKILEIQYKVSIIDLACRN